MHHGGGGHGGHHGGGGHGGHHHGGGFPHFRGRRGIRFFDGGWWWWDGYGWAAYSGAQCTSWGAPLAAPPADLASEAIAQVSANGGQPVVETWTDGITYLFAAGPVIRPCAALGYALSGSPVGAQPLENGAGRGNYWADGGSDDNYVRAAATWWKDCVGLAGCGPCLCTHPGCGCASTATSSGSFPVNCPEPEGPTDTTIRCAGEWWVRNVLPRDSAAGLGEANVMTDQGLMLGGRPVDGFGLGLNADPFDTVLNSAQQAWVLSALVDWLNHTPSGCAALPPGSPLTIPQNRVIAVMCFQAWWNTGAQIGGSPPQSLNPQNAIIAQGQAGALTQDTLGSLGTTMTVAPYAAGSPGTYPSTATKPAGMSKGTKVALGVAVGAVVIGTAIAVVSRRKRAA